MVTNCFSGVHGIQRMAAQVESAAVIHVAPILGPNTMNKYAHPLVITHANARQGAIRHVKYGLAQRHVLIKKRFTGVKLPVLQVSLRRLQSSSHSYQPALPCLGNTT